MFLSEAIFSRSASEFNADLGGGGGGGVQVFLGDVSLATNADFAHAKVNFTVLQSNRVLTIVILFEYYLHLFRKHPVVISQYCSICEAQCALQEFTGKKCSLVKVRQTRRLSSADMF